MRPRAAAVGSGKMRCRPGAAAAGTAMAVVAATSIALVGAGCARGTSDRSGTASEWERSRGGLNVRLRSEVAPRRATLGDPVRWTLTAELPSSVRVAAPVRDSSDASLELAEAAPPQSRPLGGRVRWTWSHEVRGFGLGALPMPAVRLPVEGNTVRDTLLFPPDTLVIDSLSQAATDSVLPDRGAAPTELRPIDYVVAALLTLIGIALAGLVAGAILGARRRKRAAAAAKEVPEPPASALRRALAALRQEGAALPGDVFYDRLSSAIRDYAAAVTGVPARDRTTTEIEAELKTRGGMPRDGVEALVDALRRADLAKFARSAGAWEDAVAAIKEARRLPERLVDAPQKRPAEPERARDGARTEG